MTMRKWLLTLLLKYYCKLYMNKRLFGTTIGAGQIIDRSKLHLYLNKLQHCGINLYIQKEQLILLDDERHPSLFAPIMIATLSTCAQLERDNISFRLQSGRKRYIEKGGKLGRNVGSVKTAEQMKAEYREVISLLRKGYSIRDVAKLSGRGVSTVQRVKRLIKVQSPQ